MDRHDVWMRQPGGQVGLTHEAGPKLRIAGQVRRQDLQRILARQTGMRRQVHLAHPARAQHAQDRVSGKHLANLERHGQIVNAEAATAPTIRVGRTPYRAGKPPCAAPVRTRDIRP